MTLTIILFFFLKIYAGTALWIPYSVFWHRLNWGVLQLYHWKLISEWHKLLVSIQTVHDKVGSQNGNSREHVLRSQNGY